MKNPILYPDPPLFSLPPSLPPPSPTLSIREGNHDGSSEATASDARTPKQDEASEEEEKRSRRKRSSSRHVFRKHAAPLSQSPASAATAAAAHQNGLPLGRARGANQRPACSFRLSSPPFLSPVIAQSGFRDVGGEKPEKPIRGQRVRTRAAGSR